MPRQVLPPEHRGVIPEAEAGENSSPDVDCRIIPEVEAGENMAPETGDHTMGYCLCPFLPFRQITVY